MQINIDNELVEYWPTDILAQWRNKHWSPHTAEQDQELVEDILANGMQEPLVIGVGLWSRRVRLDTGNHRIYLSPKLELTELPVVCKVGNYCIFDQGNGDHSYSCKYLIPKKQWIKDFYWAKPTQIIDLNWIKKEI